MNEPCAYVAEQAVSYWRYVLDWLPILIFIGLLVYFMRRLVKPQHAEIKQYRIEHIGELRRQNELLERIARALEQRPPD